MVPPVHAPNQSGQTPEAFTPDSRQAWVRLVIALLIGSIGGVGMWAIVVMIPAVQAEFSATRGAVSLAFTLMMFGFGLGGVIAGKITDRFGIVPAMAISHRLPRRCQCAGGAVDPALAVRGGVFPDRARHLRDLRAADGGGLALVRALSRPCRDHRRERQLRCRHDVAADCELGHADERLALHAYRHRPRLREPDDD